MQVTAFNTPGSPEWRWRIVNYAGETIGESRGRFRSIADAVTEGTKKMLAMNLVDHSKPVAWRRSTSYLRQR